MQVFGIAKVRSAVVTQERPCTLFLSSCQATCVVGRPRPSRNKHSLKTGPTQHITYQPCLAVVQRPTSQQRPCVRYKGNTNSRTGGCVSATSRLSKVCGALPVLFQQLLCVAVATNPLNACMVRMHAVIRNEPGWAQTPPAKPQESHMSRNALCKLESVKHAVDNVAKVYSRHKSHNTKRWPQSHAQHAA